MSPARTEVYNAVANAPLDVVRSAYRAATDWANQGPVYGPEPAPRDYVDTSVPYWVGDANRGSYASARRSFIARELASRGMPDEGQLMPPDLRFIEGQWRSSDAYDRFTAGVLRQRIAQRGSQVSYSQPFTANPAFRSRVFPYPGFSYSSSPLSVSAVSPFVTSFGSQVRLSLDLSFATLFHVLLRGLSVLVLLLSLLDYPSLRLPLLLLNFVLLIVD